MAKKYCNDTTTEYMDQVLRTPQLDEFVCRELLMLGCLDDLESKAFQFLKTYEEMADGENYEDSIASSIN